MPRQGRPPKTNVEHSEEDIIVTINDFYTPTDDDRASVRVMSRNGVSMLDMAKALHIKQSVLKRDYKTELAYGKANLNLNGHLDIIQHDKVVTLAKMGMSVKEIATFYMVDINMFKKEYEQAVGEGNSQFKELIRQKQVDILNGLHGDAGVVTMAKYLGKHVLGQQDIIHNQQNLKAPGRTYVTFEYDDGDDGGASEPPLKQLKVDIQDVDIQDGDT